MKVIRKWKAGEREEALLEQKSNLELQGLPCNQRTLHWIWVPFQLDYEGAVSFVCHLKIVDSGENDYSQPFLDRLIPQEEMCLWSGISSAISKPGLLPTWRWRYTAEPFGNCCWSGIRVTNCFVFFLFWSLPAHAESIVDITNSGAGQRGSWLPLEKHCRCVLCGAQSKVCGQWHQLVAVAAGFDHWVYSGKGGFKLFLQLYYLYVKSYCHFLQMLLCSYHLKLFGCEILLLLLGYYNMLFWKQRFSWSCLLFTLMLLPFYPSKGWNQSRHLMSSCRWGTYLPYRERCLGFRCSSLCFGEVHGAQGCYRTLSLAVWSNHRVNVIIPLFLTLPRAVRTVWNHL